ncbi:MAG: aminopeptidase P family protein, partial [Methanobacteriota archaeon]
MQLIQEKVNQASKLLKEFGIDCWITFVRESAINGDPVLPFLIPGDVTWHSAFIFSSTGKRIAIVGQYDRQMVEDTGAYDEVMAFVTGIKEPLLEVFKKLNPAQIAVNYSIDSEICDGITHGMYLTLEKYLSEIGMADRLTSGEKIVSALRQRKSPREIENIRAAIQQTEEIWELLRGFLKVGLSEAEVAAFIREEIARRGLPHAWDPETCPAVFTGPETAEAHYHPTERKIEPGHLVNMDFGVKVNEYCSDMQRTFYVLREDEDRAPDEVQKGFDTIVEAIEAARQAMRPGVLGHEVDTVARDLIVSRGYDSFPHGLGHQVGRFVHDGTALLGPAWEKYASKPFQPLEAGMVFT